MKSTIELLDFVLDEDDNFWVVNEINEKREILGYIVYKVDNLNSSRLNNLTGKRYVRLQNHGLTPIPKAYKQVFKPRDCLKENKNKLPQKWKNFVDVLNLIGIQDENIGIFGSYLIGFEIKKDVDFVVYGVENLNKAYANLSFIKKYLNATDISPTHIEYQYEKHKSSYSKDCDLKEIIARNIFGMQLENDILSTYRFIDEKNCITPCLTHAKKEVVTGKVVSGLTTACLPRFATIEVNNQIYKVYSSMWKFQSFAKDGDVLELFGDVNHKNKTILLNSPTCHIKYKN